jgi:glucose dehydrogenase
MGYNAQRYSPLDEINTRNVNRLVPAWNVSLANMLGEEAQPLVFQTGSGIVGQPITWERDGVQYVSVTSGIGGVYAQNAGDERLRTVPAGGSLWTFALMK